VFTGFIWLWILTLSLNVVKKVQMTYKAGKAFVIFSALSY